MAKKRKNLGSFGVVKSDNTDFSFDYFGNSVRVHPEISELTFVDFMEEATSVGENDPRAIVLVKKLVRLLVHPDDFDTFWAAAKANKQGTLDLMALGEQIVSGMAGRPTKRPSDSSDGSPETESKSEVD